MRGQRFSALAIVAAFSYRIDIALCQFGAVVKLSAFLLNRLVPSSFNGIVNVVLVRSWVEVVWVYALRIVARMPKHHVWIKFAPVVEFVCNPVSQMCALGVVLCECAVAVLHPVADPEPACRRLMNLAPEARFQ